MQGYDTIKQTVLEHIQTVFEEIEAEAVLSHQEKYALLEDAFDNATDTDELRVAFDQWYMDHSDDIGFDLNADDLWEQAVLGEAPSTDAYISDDEFDYDEDEEEDMEKEI